MLDITVDGETKKSIMSEFAGNIAVEGGYYSFVTIVGDAGKTLLCDIKKNMEDGLIKTFGTKNVEVKGLW